MGKENCELVRDEVKRSVITSSRIEVSTWGFLGQDTSREVLAAGILVFRDFADNQCEQIETNQKEINQNETNQ